MPIYVDADACPVKEEVYRVARRHAIKVYVVANAPLRVPAEDLIELVEVRGGFDAADDWVAERIGPGDIAVTADIPLADRCLRRGPACSARRGWRSPKKPSAMPSRPAPCSTCCDSPGSSAAAPPLSPRRTARDSSRSSTRQFTRSAAICGSEIARASRDAEDPLRSSRSVHQAFQFDACTPRKKRVRLESLTWLEETPRVRASVLIEPMGC